MHRSRKWFHPLERSLISAILWFLGAGLMAQKPVELDYLIRFSAPIASVHEKYIHQTLQDHEPGAGVWVDRPNSQVKVRTHVSLVRVELESAWSSIGLTITSMGLLGMEPPQERSMQAVEEPFPVLMGTGDPAADNAAYETAKAAWIAAHPEAYEQMSAPQEH